MIALKALIRQKAASIKINRDHNADFISELSKQHMEKTLISDGLFINGQTTAAQSGDTKVITNPATGEAISSIAQGSAVDVDAAVDAASLAHVEWRALPLTERQAHLKQLATGIAAAANQFADLETRNVGRPLRESLEEVEFCVDYLSYFASLDSADIEWSFVNNEGGTTTLLREPFGVCGIITPWNYPLTAAVKELTPALLAGNALVLKPSQWAPLSTILLAKQAIECGIPAGVINVITGTGITAGASLVRHPQVPRISFVGSTTIGKDIMRMSADELKNISLSLSGKSVTIICEDADLETAIPAAAHNILRNCGQDYFSRGRLLVQHPIYDEVADRLTAIFRDQIIGDPLDSDTTLGPMISKAHCKRIQKYIELGQSEGATLLYGGEPPADAPVQNGAFLQPALFGDVQPGMYIAKEEIFGPVLCMMAFENIEQAIEIANVGIYGLGATIWTKNAAQADQIARSLHAGSIAINSKTACFPDVSFSRMKYSGIGNESGIEALHQYTLLKSISTS